MRRANRANALVEFLMGLVVAGFMFLESFKIINFALVKNRAQSLAHVGLELQASGRLEEALIDSLIEEYAGLLSGSSWRWERGAFRDIPAAAFYPLVKMEVRYPGLKGASNPQLEGREFFVGLIKK